MNRPSRNNRNIGRIDYAAGFTDGTNCPVVESSTVYFTRILTQLGLLPLTPTGGSCLFTVTGGNSPTNITSSQGITCGDSIHFWSTNTVSIAVSPGSARVGLSVVPSTQAGNVLTTGVDGKLYVPAAGAAIETPLTVSSSSTVTLAASGAANHTLAAAVKLSATIGNILIANLDGLFVPASAVVETSLVAADSSTIDFTTSGVAGHNLTGAVRISTTVGNALTSDALGLFVPVAVAAIQTPITGITNSKAQVVTSGIGNHTVEVVVKVSATAGNAITSFGDGLFVATANLTNTPLTVLDSPTVDLTAGGIDNHSLIAAVKVSVLANNQLAAVPDGLFVAPTAQTPVTIVPNPGILINTSGVNSHTLNASIRLSSTAGNQAQVLTDGLFVPTAIAFATLAETQARTSLTKAMNPFLVGTQRGKTKTPRLLSLLPQFTYPEDGSAVEVGDLVKITDYNRDFYRWTGLSWVSVNGGVAYLKDFDPIGDGVTDDTTKLQAWATCGIKNKYLGTPLVSYRISAAITFEDGSRVYGDGDSSVVDATLVSFSSLSPNNKGAFQIEGSITPLTTVTSAVKGEMFIDLASTAAISPSNIIALNNTTNFSWSLWRDYYKAGQMFKVSSKSVNRVYLHEKVSDGYPAGTSVLKITPKTASFKNFKIILGLNQASNVGLFCNLLNKLRIDDVSIEGVTYGGIVAQLCYDTVIQNSTALENGVLNGNNYGLVISGSHHLSVVGGTYRALRHGIAIGNVSVDYSWPARHIGISNANVIGYGGNVPGADTHGSNDAVTYESCNLFGGAIVSGRDITYRDCNIYSSQSNVADNQLGPIIEFSEIVGGAFTFDNCRLYSSNGNPTGARAVIELGHNGSFASPQVNQDATVRFKDCTVYCAGITSDAILDVYGNGSTSRINLDIDGLTLMDYAGDRVLVLGNNSAVPITSKFIRIEGVTGITPGASLVLVDSGNWNSLPMRVQGLSGTVAAGTGASVVFNHIFPKKPSLRLFSEQPSSLTITAFTAAGFTFTSSVNTVVHWECDIKNI